MPRICCILFTAILVTGFNFTLIIVSLEILRFSIWLWATIVMKWLSFFFRGFSTFSQKFGQRLFSRPNHFLAAKGWEKTTRIEKFGRQIGQIATLVSAQLCVGFTCLIKWNLAQHANIYPTCNPLTRPFKARWRISYICRFDGERNA